MVRYFVISLFLLPSFLGAQVDTFFYCGNIVARPKCHPCVLIDTCKAEMPNPITIFAGYEGSFESPIRLERGSKLLTWASGYFINEPRYNFYRKLHEFANDAEFKGHEKEILDGFGGFLTESDAILKSMSENTEKLELSSERLKIAQDAVQQLTAQVDELARQNLELKRKISEPVKQKKKFGVPLLIGVTAGVIVGVLIN